jgi:hypothetical protein
MTDPKKSEAFQFALAVAMGKLPDLEEVVEALRERRRREQAGEGEQPQGAVLSSGAAEG